MEEIVIVGAARTPIGKFGGSLAKTPAAELGALVIRKVLERAGVAPEQVSEVIMGQVLTAGVGQNPARQAAIKAGIPYMVPAMTINKVCGSGLQAAMLGAQAIANGDSDLVIAGGQESMSLAPHALNGSRDGFRMGDAKMVDTMIVDGLWDVFNQYHMGVTAENVAKEYAVTREEQDEFAVASQNKAEAAQKAGRFKDEIVTVEVPSRKGPVMFADDEGPRHGTTLEALKGLKPAFDKSGPVTASKRCLARAGWEPKDLDLMEINEAFAAQAIAVNRQMGWDTKKVNVNGGAIALGHPIGASGARVLVTLLHEMQKRDAKKGLASLCIGGGMGVALAVERT